MPIPSIPREWWQAESSGELTQPSRLGWGLLRCLVGVVVVMGTLGFGGFLARGDEPIRPVAVPEVGPAAAGHGTEAKEHAAEKADGHAAPVVAPKKAGAVHAPAAETHDEVEEEHGAESNGHGEKEGSHGAKPSKAVGEKSDVLKPTRRIAGSELVKERLLEDEPPSESGERAVFDSRLEVARRLRREGHPDMAVRDLVAILRSKGPNDVKRPALLELSSIAEESGQMGRAQQILAQYTRLFSKHPSVVEVYLRQGILYRDMGATELALSKFHSVFSSALAQRFDQLEYYRRMVLQAQTEIAETYYLNGRWEEARDFLQRVMKLDAPPITKMQVQYKLLRVLTQLDRNEEAIANANQFIQRYPDAGQVPEVRFILASALKKLGRNDEALAQVLQLLEAGRNAAKERPEMWTYWQKRAGNDIANQLYRDGEYVGTLEIYRKLAELDGSAGWQLPAWYQIGLVYERLEQPEKALEVYDRIAGREAEVKKDPGAANLMVVVEMAKWRKGNLSWMRSATTNLATLRPLVSTATPETKNERAQ